MKLTVRMQLQSGIHHGSGTGLGPLVDRAVLRRTDGVPYLAGSAIKGKLRSVASQIQRATIEPDPHASEPAGFCVNAAGCLVCRLFGNPMRQGKATFSDALPAEAWMHQFEEYGVTRETRTTTAIDRHRRVARAAHLFTTEIVPPHVEFQFTVEGSFQRDELELLRNCFKLVTSFGGGSARGLGSVQMAILREEA